MKQKYYLRGLGIGILITALVFSFVTPSELSEEEIIKRAEELGYTKPREKFGPSIDIKDLMGTSTPTPTETPVPEKITEPVETPVPTPEPTPDLEVSSTPVPTPTPEPTSAPVQKPTDVPETSVLTATIVIERGNTATVVCDKIEAAGILADGDELRDYMIDQGLTDYINIGTYTLSSDMSLKEIAKLLTGR